MTDFTASNGLRVSTDANGSVGVSWGSPRDTGWTFHSADETQALQEFFAAETAATAAELSQSVADHDPTVPHRYRGNASGLTCWVGQGHDSGICGKRGEDRIHDPYGASWGFTAGGWEFYFIVPDDARCAEREGGGEQCIHLAASDHVHEADPRRLGGDSNVVARRRRAGAFEVAQ